MNIEKDRLLSLIDFTQQSAKLRSKAVSTVAAHNLFSLYEHETQGLPGIRLSVNNPEAEDEIWISIKRLSETRPPVIDNPTLFPWVQLNQISTKEPYLKDAIAVEILIKSGHLLPKSNLLVESDDEVEVAKELSLSDYERCTLVKSLFSNYLTAKWRPWVEEEKLRIQTIQLYSKLFMLKQQLEGSMVEAQIELVWGVGIGIWKCNGVSVKYPLMGILVELTLNPKTAEMEIRPRDVEARMELDWYAFVNNPGVAEVEKAAKEFFETATNTFSPFDRGTFEPLLRSVSVNLDSHGVYWRDQTQLEDRTLPKEEEELRVTDTWALFARPRSNNLFIQDLEKLRKQSEEAVSFPPVVMSLLTDPSTTNLVVELPSFRGMSASSNSSIGSSGVKERDLYFPKPFNDEQVRIIQQLEMYDGVVVQGPPGTGKTHTIANVICHYLAEGKRVLVTSMKEPALAVLREQLPEEIRPLAIALLSTEQDGMKQFEHAINKIASEVQSLDPRVYERDIKHLGVEIDNLHSKIASIDFKVGEWAIVNLSKIVLENEEIDPQDAARELVEGSLEINLIPDALGISPEFTPLFSDEEVVQLREGRRVLGSDISYLFASLPQPEEFPNIKSLLEVHRDLSKYEILKQNEETGLMHSLADSSQETLALAQKLIDDIDAIRRLRHGVEQAKREWSGSMYKRLRLGANISHIDVLEALGKELEQAVEKNKVFFARPVKTPKEIELNPEMVRAVQNLAEKKQPFGFQGLFGKSLQKQQIDSILVLGSRPVNEEGWQHVANYLSYLKRLAELTLRWNMLAKELEIKIFPEDVPENALLAAQEFALFVKLKIVVKAEAELRKGAAWIFPNWANIGDIVENSQLLSEFDSTLKHYLAKNRLLNVWATKEHFQKAIDGRDGKIVSIIRIFLSNSLGNPGIEDSVLHSEWTKHIAELKRVLGLGKHLADVRLACDKIERSGAPQYSTLLRQAHESAGDCLLPNNWRKIWRQKRIATYLKSIDAHEELNKLAIDRQNASSELSRAYREIVVKRTWLRLAENSSPSIRVALQAYLSAIKKIGKGTGVRAIRYRKDARNAASKTNSVIPCWIMSHYRVSESLPPELGCFDLVIIDEASQSDLTSLPALLRAKKALIVGDDKQVSPEGVGLEEEKIRSLMSRFLSSQVELYRPQMTPERSTYDLFKVVYSNSMVMLKEHFRCVSPIIEYSKREFYNHELQPLRLPKASERLDPPLIDILVEDGFRQGDTNLPEARVILNEIKKLVSDKDTTGRSIGVVSLLAAKQALLIWEMLRDEIGPELMQKHRIECGDARTFQGKERDIMFLSMVSAPNDVGAPLSRDTFAQRFNVAASRARDRMYLVRSVETRRLSQADKLRRSLIQHFETPYQQDEIRVDDQRKLCESDFEREMYDELAKRGYWLTPQVKVGQYRIDLVVEGQNDARLAIECDGDKYHGPEKWAGDMQRQRVLERAGWVFWRCFASAFYRRRTEMLDELFQTLRDRGIEPTGAEGAPKSIHSERRVVNSTDIVAGIDLMQEADNEVKEAIFTPAALIVQEIISEQPAIVFHEPSQDVDDWVVQKDEYFPQKKRPLIP